MLKYRAPSQLCHVNDGWQETTARNADEALAFFREKRGMTLTLMNIQVWVGDRWAFASDTASHFGGYSLGAEA